MPVKTASEAYHERKREIIMKLKQVRQLADKHDGKNHINWTHVGDLGHIAELLDEVLGVEK